MSKSIPRCQEHDPYLVPGQGCEVWNKSSMIIILMYFSRYDNNKTPVFVHKKNILLYKKGVEIGGLENYYDYYRPIGTEWDFAPDWAVCSTVDKFGRIEFWSVDNPNCQDNGYWNKNYKLSKNMVCGHCPDKTRYQGEAWKTSLRMRREWAKVG